jgi:hypothetical protein
VHLREAEACLPEMLSSGAVQVRSLIPHIDGEFTFGSKFVIKQFCKFHRVLFGILLNGYVEVQSLIYVGTFYTA